MSSQQICLKWNGFQSNIVTSFESLWEEEGLVDVTLASDGQCIRAHKVILSACSPFFKKIFQANPCRHPVIILQDVHFSEVESLLSFVYKGEVNIDQENLPALLRAAETLQIRGLYGATEQVNKKISSPRKTTESSHNNVDDFSPPAKRHKAFPKSRSPVPPPTPVAANLNSHQSPSRHFSSSPAEPCQSSPQLYDPTISSKVEVLDESCSPLPLMMTIEESYDEGNEDSMDSMAKHASQCLETEQLKGNGELLSYEKLPYGCLLPRSQVLTTWAKARTLEQLACDLMKILFTTEERILCNVNGKMGKRQFNVHKVQLIREALLHYSNMPLSEFEEQWKICVTKIDTANRGLKRNLVLKGRKAICLM